MTPQGAPILPAIVLHCPNCQKAYQMSPEMIAKYAGKMIACRGCKQSFSFDAAMDAAAQAAGHAEAAEEGQAPPRRAFEPGRPTRGLRCRWPSRPRSHPHPRRFRRKPRRRRHAAANCAGAVAPARCAARLRAARGLRLPAAGTAFSFGDLFTFQRMALPPVLPLVFWLGVAYCLYNGLGTLSHLVISRYSSFPKVRLDGLAERILSINGLTTFLDALFWIILGSAVLARVLRAAPGGLPPARRRYAPVER